MKKITIFDSIEPSFEIDIAKKLVAMRHEISELEGQDRLNAKKYFTKNVLVLGDPSDQEFVKSLVSQAKWFTHIGWDINNSLAVESYTEEKGIPKVDIAIGILDYAGAWSSDSNGKIIETYQSTLYTIPELVTKYYTKPNVKVSKLIRYVSQVYKNRNRANFDHFNIDELQPIYDAFIKYNESNDAYNEEELIQIYNQYEPS